MRRRCCQRTTRRLKRKGRRLRGKWLMRSLRRCLQGSWCKQRTRGLMNMRLLDKRCSWPHELRLRMQCPEGRGCMMLLQERGRRSPVRMECMRKRTAR